MAWGILVLITLVYFAWMYTQSTLRYDTFKATAFDLGNMDQAIWNTLHGRWFQFTNHGSNWYGIPIRLSQHVEPIIIPLSLLYLLHSDVHTLLAFQTLALALGSLPVFLLTRKFIPDWPLVAPLFALSYLLAPALIGLNMYDFHPAPDHRITGLGPRGGHLRRLPAKLGRPHAPRGRPLSAWRADHLHGHAA